MNNLKGIVSPGFYNNYGVHNDDDAKIRNKVRKFQESSHTGGKIQQLENFLGDLKAGKSSQDIKNFYHHLKKSSGYLIEEAVYRAFKNCSLCLKEMESDPCFGRTTLMNNDIKEILNQTFSSNNRDTSFLSEMVGLLKQQKPLKEKLITATILSDLARLYQEAQNHNGTQGLKHVTDTELRSLIGYNIGLNEKSINESNLPYDQKVKALFLLGKSQTLAKYSNMDHLRSKINEIVELLNEDSEKILDLDSTANEKLGFHVWENEGKPETPNYDGQAAFAEDPSLLHKRGPDGQMSAIEILIYLIRANISERKGSFMSKLETTFINCNAERFGQVDPANLEKIRPILIGVEYREICSAGGLAEAITGMAEGLSRQLGEAGKSRVILPRYSSLDQVFQKNSIHIERIDDLSTNHYTVSKATKNRVDLYFIDDNYGRFGLEENTPYGKGKASIKTRFACFSNYAANLSLTMADRIKREGNIPVVHLHDWHTAGAAQLIKKERKDLPVVYTYHNNDYAAQGTYSDKEKNDYRFGIEGDNLFLVGLKNADHTTTVSRSFAKESMTSMYGFGIHNDITAVAKQNKLTGITNGSDPDNWDPSINEQLKNWIDPDTKEHIKLTFSRNDDIVAKKRLVKEQLKKWFAKHGSQYGLRIQIDPNKPLTYFVGRYTGQKGLDLLPAAADEVVQQKGQFISVGVLNHEDVEGAQAVSSLQKKFAQGTMKDNCCVISDTKNGEVYEIQGKIGALIRAAADFMVVPSRFEPCGLVQYQAWLFGSEVIASQVGGLNDTVDGGPYGNGKLFKRTPKLEESTENFKFAIWEAHEHLKRLNSKDRQNRLKAFMEKAANSSWTSNGQLSPISQYLCVYDRAIKDSIRA
jgi:starch synthase